MFLYSLQTALRAADALKRSATLSKFDGLNGKGTLESFAALWSQTRGLVESLRKAKYEDLLARDCGVRFITGEGRIRDSNTVIVNDEVIFASRIIIATGTRPTIPDIPGLNDGPFLTHESVFELKDLPSSLVVVGGGFVGVEFAQMFARLGTAVTLVTRSTILSHMDTDISEGLLVHLREEKINVLQNTSIENIAWSVAGEVVLRTSGGVLSSTHILIAAGRSPNTDRLVVDHEKCSISLNSDGFLHVDNSLRTNVEGIYGAGDVLGHDLFVYTAAQEGSIAASNALNCGLLPLTLNDASIPWVVFSDPQVAGVGFGEREASSQGIEYDVSIVQMSAVPRAIVARETRGFVKLLREKSTRKIIGVRIVASEGGELIMQVSLAIRCGVKSDDLAQMLHPYLTLSESIKMAAIGFDHDITKLSCCSSL